MSEKSKTFVLPWSIAGFCFLACLIIAHNAYRNAGRVVEKRVEVPKIVEVTNTIQLTNTLFVTNTVEVTNIVEVPAKIPPFYIGASNFMANYLGAELLTNMSGALRGVTNVSTIFHVTTNVSDDLSESEVKNRFELTLRRNGVPIRSDSRYLLSISVDGLWNDGRSSCTYSVRVELDEIDVVWRNGKPLRVVLVTWNDGNFGYAGKNVFRNAILDSAQGVAEEFANQFLQQNPKE